MTKEKADVLDWLHQISSTPEHFDTTYYSDAEMMMLAENAATFVLASEDVPARVLSFEEVASLPFDRCVWIQYGAYELVMDQIADYDPDADEISLENGYAIYTQASKDYLRTWCVWDKLPTQDQINYALCRQK